MIIQRIISAHEHLGFGRLTFSKDNWTDYNATPEALETDLKQIIDYTGCKQFGCILYPQMPYKLYSTQKEYLVSTEIINKDFYEYLSVLPQHIKYYPFIYLRCSDSIQVNESLIKKYGAGCFGLKIHPDAEMINAVEFRNSGVLKLAEEYNLPVTVHCSRPNGTFDYDKIKKGLFDEIEKRKVRVNIAHLGFFSDSILNDTLPEHVYTDISPLGIIADQYQISGGDPKRFRDFFCKFAHRNSHQIMYGGDFPYNIQRWADGTIHGRSREEDLNELDTIINEWNTEIVEGLFSVNCLHFLGKSVD